jgi:hypothetical protein
MPDQPQVDIETGTISSGRAVNFFGMPAIDIEHDIGILESNAMGDMGPGTGGLGSATGIGAGEGGSEGGY